MEDQKLRTPYDSINPKKNSWSKEMFEIRSILQGLVGKIATARPQNNVPMYENRDLSPAPPTFRHKYASINFGRFCGDNPEAWIFQAEHYFEFYEIAEKYKLSLASLYLDGEALEWYLWLFQNKQLADWKHFTAKVMIRFRKQHLESQRCHLLNNQQVTSVIDYQSRFEDVSSGYGDFNVLASDIAYVSPQWNDIINSPLPQCCDEKSEGNNKTNAPKVLDDLSERPTDANSIDISCKLSQLEVEDPHKVCKLTIRDTSAAYFPSDLTYSVSPTAEETDCENDAKSEDKNDEEEIATIRDGKVYPQHRLGLAQCWKKMSSIPSTCSYPNLTTRGITSRLGHDVILLIMNLFPPDQFGLEFPFDPGSSLLTMYNLVFCVASSDLDHDKFIMSTLRNSRNWVDTGQGRNIYDFLSSKSRENVIEEKVWRMLQGFVESYSRQSPNIPVNRVVKLLCAMFGLIHESRTVSRHIHFNHGQFLDCGAFPFDSVLYHFLVSLWVQTFQPRLPRPLPKPPFSVFLLNFLGQIEKSVEIELKFDFDGLVVIGGVDSKTNAHLYTANLNSKVQPATDVLTIILQEWKVLKLRNKYKVKLQVVHLTGYTFYGVIERVDLVVLHRLHYGLIAMERQGEEGASKTVRQNLKVNNFSFDGLEYVKKYHLHHISIDRKGIDVEKEWSEDIAEFVSYINEFLLVNMSLVPRVAASNVSKIKIMIYGSLNDIIRWFTLLDTSQSIIYLCHVILYKVMKVQKLSKSDGVNSAILKAANKIIILFLMVFTCSSQGNYNTPSCRMKFPDMKLEDKVLF
ncbi:hypothetical protein KY285_005270 [Solanum tuberosum]|nr:hypothetical protein KY285_005270 [Solanum tuberosum]